MNDNDNTIKDTSGLNAYEEKQEVRRERLEAMAEKARSESASTHASARKMAEVIPFGQPILIGHYSEGRDRRYRGRIHDKFGKAFELAKKADYYERKTEAVGSGGISSDDPDAIVKLRAELTDLEASQETMKRVNALLRKSKTTESRTAALLDAGFNETRVRELLTPDCFGNLGFAGFKLTNNSANIRRVTQRIEELEKQRQQPSIERTGKGYTCRQDTEENRIMFFFDGKPDEDTRNLLKSYAFKWSPTRGAWVRQITGNAIHAARSVCEALDK